MEDGLAHSDDTSPSMGYRDMDRSERASEARFQIRCRVALPFEYHSGLSLACHGREYHSLSAGGAQSWPDISVVFTLQLLGANSSCHLMPSCPIVSYHVCRCLAVPAPTFFATYACHQFSSHLWPPCAGLLTWIPYVIVSQRNEKVVGVLVQKARTGKDFSFTMVPMKKG